MTENGFGYGTSSADERATSAEGRADGLQAAMIGMMRVVSRGLNGEAAYQALARDLEAEAKNYEGMSSMQGLAGLRARATHFQLKLLAEVFSQKPGS